MRFISKQTSQFFLVITAFLLLFGTTKAATEDSAIAAQSLSPIGAWKDTFNDAIAVFLEDGQVLFTFLKQPQREDWHLVGKWKVIEPGKIEITLPRKPPPGELGDKQRDIYVIEAQSPNELISPHGGKMLRIVK